MNIYRPPEDGEDEDFVDDDTFTMVDVVLAVSWCLILFGTAIGLFYYMLH